MLDQFQALFTGSTTAHGEWHLNKVPPAVTERVPATSEHYESHLAGKVGLGIVPVDEKGSCIFGAVDVDIDTIDHASLYAMVTKHAMPLNVCRSKSGGAHLYLFTRAPIQAEKLQQVLHSYAVTLGYASAEIFPKQRKTSAQNVGNWINLPYFGGDATTRYAVGPNGALTLDEFIKTAKYYDPAIPVHTHEPGSLGEPVQPPCLQALTTQGTPAGFRNQTLFNYAIFYRKSNPKDWEDLTRRQNSQYFNPPLDLREVRGVLQSASRTKYQYTCDVEPLRSMCDRAVCQTLPFGVGHMPWNEEGGHDDLVVSNLRKLLTSPPRYIVEVNGRDVTLEWEEFFGFAGFKSKVGLQLDIVIAPRKQLSWEQTVRKLLQEKTDIEAPDDASTMGIVVDKLYEFLALRERALELEDILRGLPVQQGKTVLFRIVDFKRYLQNFKLDKIETADMFLFVKAQGALHRRIRVNGRMITAWSFPVDQLNEQTEDFQTPEFVDVFKDEV